MEFIKEKPKIFSVWGNFIKYYKKTLKQSIIL